MNHDQYGLPDIPAMSQTPVVESFPIGHHPSLGAVPLPTPYHYEPWGGSGSVLCTAARGGSSATCFSHHEHVGINPLAPTTCGVDLEGGFGNEIAGNGRWPRQETLTLLEIRSRLDLKFKEANQKGPLWDEVSRIMAEENGYMRSGKKCREKFENLYKYYKKTKEGKAGRQDGKHYRFFRQLEAIYGGSNSLLVNQAAPVHETNLGGYNNMVPNNMSYVQENKTSESLSFTNEYSSELEISSSEDNVNDDNQDLSAIAVMMSGGKSKEKRVGRDWKGKVKEFIDVSMRKVMESQEEWMERMVKAMEVKERERMCKEEEWRKQEAARLDRELEFWAKERAWLEARDATLMEALKKVTQGGGSNSDHGNVMSMFCNIMRDKEDTRTYNYFQHLDLYNQDHQQQQQQQQQQDVSRSRRTCDEDQMTRIQREGDEGMDMDSNSNSGFLHNNNEEMWWDKYGLKLSNDKYHRGN